MSNSGDITTGVAVTYNNWVHTAVSLTGGGALKLYINGSLVYSTSIGITQTNYTIYFGGPFTYTRYVGNIDDFKCYNSILSAGQIKAIYLN
jgi:hypothetical protein